MTQKRQDRLDEKLDKLIDGVGDIKTKVAVLNESFSNSEKDREATQKTVENLSGRVSTLEKFQTKIATIAGVAGSAIALGGDYIKHKLLG